jgi:lysophospholipase L1-like esterase
MRQTMRFALLLLFSMVCDCRSDSGAQGSESLSTSVESSEPSSTISAAPSQQGTLYPESPNPDDLDGGGVPADTGVGTAWLPSWATTIQQTEERNLPPPLAGNTLRQFVWPTYGGREVRVRISNEKGSTPLTIEKVHLARARTTSNPANSNGEIDTATDAALTFGGASAITIPSGETTWSDPAEFDLRERALTAITMRLGGDVPAEITGHPGSRTTSYVVSGDQVASQAMAEAQTRDRWYFIDDLEVMAPASAYAIAMLGDSITDGFGISNDYGRWPDFMTIELDNDPVLADSRSVLNLGMGANFLTRPSDGQDSGVIRFEREVLGREKVKWLIVMEGVNDLNAGAAAAPLIDAYRSIIERAHEKGILVYGSPITPCSGCGARLEVNQWIRTSGEFDAILDLATPVSNGEDWNPLFQNDTLHPNRAGYEVMGKAVNLSLFHELMASAP